MSNNKDQGAIIRPQDRANLIWFFGNYFKGRAGLFVIIAVLIALQAAIYQQFLSFTENGLRMIFDSAAVTDLLRICAVVFVLFLVRALLAFAVPRISAQLSNDAVRLLREHLVQHLMRLDLSWFEQTKPGELIQRIVVQSQSLARFFGQRVVTAARDLATIVVVSGWLVWKSPLLFSFALIFFPLVAWVLRLLGGRVRDAQRGAETSLGAYISGIEEMSGAMRTVKIANQEHAETHRLGKIADQVRVRNIASLTVQALTVPMIDLITGVVYVVVIGGGGYMIISGNSNMDAAGLITFLVGLVLVFDPARNVAKFIAQLQSNLVLLERVRGLMQVKPTIMDRVDAETEFDASADIVFDKVNFSYAPEAPLFRELSLTIPAGKVTAIVGATGSGKTTILSLLTRLYEVDSGQITIGERDIRDIKIAALRSAFSVVAQDIVIFDASLSENIRYVNPDATEQEIQAVAEAVQLDGLLRSRGDERLGARGAMLSGGQKQRIAIARAMLRPAPILLQDEATSALDQTTETQVRAALSKLGQGRTTIIVSHRLSAVVDADQILVLDGGRLVEQGSHASLMEQSGIYAAMYEAQKTGYR